MISNWRNFVYLTAQVIRKCEFQSSFAENLTYASRCDLCLKNQIQNFHTNMPRMSYADVRLRRATAKSEAEKEGKVTHMFQGDLRQKRLNEYFPTFDLPNRVFHGIKFKELPIVNIKATKNNTIFSLSNPAGEVKILVTCGTEGFKHTRKGTNVAAQAAGSSFGAKALKCGYKHVRVLIRGLGAGRLSSIKGLQLSGLNIISISDGTIDQTQLRPRKQKKL